MRSPCALGALFLFGLAACGEDDGPSPSATDCAAFCASIPCPADSAGCDSGGQCACFGCLEFYERHYQPMANTAPRCAVD